MDALEIALTHVSEEYQKTTASLKQEEDRSHAIVEIPISVVERIGRNLEQVKEYLQQQKAKPTELGEYFNHLEQTLKETITNAVKEAVTNTIKETITTTITQTLEESLKETRTITDTRTYAQAASTTPPPSSTPAINRTNEIQQRNLQRKVQQRRERNKLEVVLNTQEMDLDTKEQVEQHSHAEITAKLQQTVESQVKDNFPIIHGIEKLKSQNIRIHCNTEEEAEQLRKLNWDTAYNGLTVHQSKYGIMIPGVPTEMINPDDLKNPEIARQLEYQNREKEIKIIGMKTLRHKLKNNTQHYSLVIFLTNPKSADQCIKHGLYINHQRFFPEKYTPQFQLIQCYKCQKFGHHATKCRSPHEVCAKCSEHHSTSQCQSEAHKCAGCKEEHPAWHQECPKRIDAIQNLTTRKREAPPYYNE
jgi:hypothetical protein